MSKPVIFTIDDESEVLNAIERDLRQQYQRNYRVIKASSGAQALDTVRQLKQRGTAVALFLVDEKMPGMTGTQFLAEAMVLFPEAKRALLTAYADTQTAIAAINTIGLDHYLMKPWEPPEERLYPVIDELLSDWVANVRPPFDGIRVAGTSLSTSSYAIRDFLSRNLIPYQWVDLDLDAPARALVEATPDGISRLPAVMFPDGTMLAEPSLRDLAAKIGLHTAATKPFYDVVVIGGGPAGLAAAVYAASEGLRVVLVERDTTGGQAGTSSKIENYLGFPNGISGADLARRATGQAVKFGAEIVSTQEVASVSRTDPYRIVTLSDGTTLSCYAVVVAPGMEVKQMDAPGMKDLVGTGVYYGAALSEAATYRDRHVVIVGGGNSAGQGAMFFSRYAKRVSVLVRTPTLSAMSQYLVDRIADAKNVDVQSGTAVQSVRGNGRLESMTLVDTQSGATRELDAAAMFVFIGSAPRTGMLDELVLRDRGGFILTGRDLLVDGKWPSSWTLERDPFLYETNVPGIFAAGDARHGSSKRVAAAVGEGSATIGMVHEYLRTV
ncbi:MAG: FAD-dependent oxidoreductase [Vicinamibacterales bacterium]